MNGADSKTEIEKRDLETEESKLSVQSTGFGVAIAYAILSIAVGLFNLPGVFLASPPRVDLSVEGSIQIASGVLLLMRKKIAFPFLAAGFLPVVISGALHGFYIGHLLWIVVIFGVIAYVKRRRHLLH